MSSSAKKLKVESEEIDADIAAELAMLDGLKKNDTAPKAEVIDESFTSMKDEDLEYPDMPGAGGPKTKSDPNATTVTSLDDVGIDDLDDIGNGDDGDSDVLDDIDDIDLDDDFDEVGSLSAKQKLDASFLEKKNDLEESAQAEAEVDIEEESQDDESVGESTQVRNKQELLRLKRKKALEEKKRRRMLEEEKAEEEKRRQQEYEKANNILSIDELKRQAMSDGNNTDSSDAVPAATQSASSESAANSVKAASALLSKKAVSADSGGPVSSNNQRSGKAVYMEEGPRRPLSVRLLSSMFVVVSELLKIAAPSALLWFYMEHDKSRQLSAQALTHMASGDPFQMEVALNILTTNFSYEHNRPYFELVRKKVERELQIAWQENPMPIEDRAAVLRTLSDYTFVDSKLNLPEMVKSGHEQASVAMRERYENLYEAEMKVANQPEVVDNLRQANIFLRQQECLKSYERFKIVSGIIGDSLAALKGEILSINCAYQKDAKAALTYFKKKDSVDRIRAINKEIELGNAPKVPSPALEAKPAPSLPKAPERAPAQNKKKKK